MAGLRFFHCHLSGLPVLLLSLLLGTLSLAAIAQDVLPAPALTAHVMDSSGTLSAAQIQSLEQKLATFEREQGSQLVFLLVPTTQPEDVASYANRVLNDWKLGRQRIGDGLLVVVAKNDRKVRIEVTKALEGAIPDLAAKRIIDEAMTPSFRQGNFAAGLEAGADRLFALIRGEALPVPTPAARRDEDGVRWMDLGVLLFVVLPMVGSLSRRILGRKLGTLATGGAVGLLTLAFTASLLIAAIAAMIAMLLTFIAGTSKGASLLVGGHHAGRWGSGTWGSGGGGGFGAGGGGFSSGGGGDAGGGGASGDW